MPTTPLTTICSLRRAGFTLLELIITVLILGIVTAAATPVLSGALTESRLDAAATSTLVALEYARFRAMSTGSEHIVKFNSGTGRVEVEALTYTKASQITDTSRSTMSGEDVDNKSGYSAVPDPLNPRQDYDFRFSDDTRYEGVAIISAGFGGSSEVRFDTVGSPSSTGTVVLRLGSRTRTVTVSATGQVSIT